LPARCCSSFLGKFDKFDKSDHDQDMLDKLDEFNLVVRELPEQSALGYRSSVGGHQFIFTGRCLVTVVTKRLMQIGSLTPRLNCWAV
jgi:hypothetical protein